MVSKADYLEHFIDGVDRVTGGTHGGICENRWLVNHYSPEMLPLVDKFLNAVEDDVRAETVLLLSYVRERSVLPKIEEMRRSGSEKVRMACVGYLTSMKADDNLIPELLDVLEHRTGREFTNAASKLCAVAREEDVPRIRRVYGQVRDGMRAETKNILESVIARNPSLKTKEDLILSLPVYPDEDAFERFLDGMRDYIDVRYRRSVHPAERISAETYGNVVHAFKRMRTRLYNEADNLQYYGPDKEDRYGESAELLSWAVSDLSGKTVAGADRSRTRACPRCGGLMVSYKGVWICPDCGGA